MNKKLLFFTAIFLLLMPALLFAWGGKEKAKTVQVTGIVALVGNDPFSEIVIRDSENDWSWYIPREERAKLIDLQHRTVTVEGKEVITEMKSASGFLTFMRRELRNVRIIMIEEYSGP